MTAGYKMLNFRTGVCKVNATGSHWELVRREMSFTEFYSACLEAILGNGDWAGTVVPKRVAQEWGETIHFDGVKRPTE